MRARMREGAYWLTIGAALVAAACGRSSERADARDPRPAIAVDLYRTSSTRIPDWVEAGGFVRARSTASLVSRIVAPITAVRAVPGDRVRAGQPLVVLDGRDLAAGARRAQAGDLAAREGVRAAAAERDAARAALDLARASHDRIARLHERRSATAQEYDEAVGALRGAEARLAAADARAGEAESALAEAGAARQGASVAASYAVVTAPFDGIVTEKLVDPGNMASPGTPLLRVEDTSAFKFEARVDSSRLSGVSQNAQLPVIVDSGSTPQHLEGRVVEIARAVDSGSSSVLLTIELPASSGLRSGMFGRVRLRAGEHMGITVPASAVVHRGHLASIFVFDNGRARLRMVSVAEPVENSVEVISGLDAGESVVVRPPSSLTDGHPLETRSMAGASHGPDAGPGGTRGAR